MRKQIHPGRLTWNLKMDGLEDDFPFQLDGFKWLINGLPSREWINISHRTGSSENHHLQNAIFDGDDMLVPWRVSL